MIDKPFVGQKVRLNDRGMESIQGLRSLDEFTRAQNLTITELGECLTHHKGVKLFRVEVEPQIKKGTSFFLTNRDLDAR